ncbi:glycosyltransferase 87 family protein [Granulicella sp. dw_53]|uniref:glycosyltransferase 87 family protein n=1 Tax=Granulicella sp. dw_53 TaxID=2719792 RepID=UPI001BD3D779|nr:glycosyltransferase 87 family protein [Granulicella sp. dw_53]
MIGAASRRTFLESTIFLMLCAFLLGYTLPRAWRTLNTDFPNYYLAASIAREGTDPSRAYEWIWLQREKDHREIDQRIVGLVPITPFSTLVMWPIASLRPLAAKHIWTIFNLLLLPLIALLLRRITPLSLLQIGILILVSFSLHRNLLYGQYYILLLAILTAACWAAQRGYSWIAGALVGLGAAVKIFPVLFVLYFLRKKDWKSLCACLLAIVASLVISISVFGWNLHRTYLLQVLPWTLRGDCLDPYNLASSSISSLFHRLFIYEPQWNPHPAIHAPILFAILYPLAQLLILVPIFWCLDRNDRSPARISLEWSALLVASLTISPLPASYHFTVFILPIAVLFGKLLQEKRSVAAMAVALLYLAIGYPGWNTASSDGWSALLHVPRLYVLILMTSAYFYLLKGTQHAAEKRKYWLVGGAAVYALSALIGVRHQRGLFDDYAYRLPMSQQTLLVAQPVTEEGSIRFITLSSDGYHVAKLSDVGLRGIERSKDLSTDQLAFAVGPAETWTETVSKRSVLQSSIGGAKAIEDAESPAVTHDGLTIAFLRTVDGRKQLFLRDMKDGNRPDRQMTRSSFGNLHEVAFHPNGSIFFSATPNHGRPGIYTMGDDGQIHPLSLGEARYPAISPDGHWLAYSSFQSGNWNLSLQDLSNGATHRISKVPCNQIQPGWEADSKTLLYGSDCGRALWFTAISRRRVVQ